ncbi:MAG: GTP-binding protein EngB required for normal cell division [Myxococcota bacterium]|jgi:GTP-binding protein EngB required for normal cell division
MSEPADTLPELLRRCHRDELLPLAASLSINPDGLGLGALANNCALNLRRRGGHMVANQIRRGGDGPPYAEILIRLCAKQGRPVPTDIESAELGLLRWWAERAWGRLDDTQRASLQEALDLATLPEQPPEDVTTLTVRGRLGELVPWNVGVAMLFGPAKFLLIPLLPLWPLFALIGLVYLGRPRDEKMLPAVLEVARLRQVVRHRVTVGVVGSPSCGKDAAIRAIFDVDSGNINPVAGSTKTVAITRLPGATALYVVNTPGMGDVVESVTEEARQVFDHIDIYLYLVNTQGGVQERELSDWRKCKATGRPVAAIINKIDTLRPEDRQRYLDDARGKLSAPEEDFFATAFDPLPQLSETPIGLDEVRVWIADRLAGLGKDATELPWV